MFLIGVFSTHITYIVLALLYIFGYGTYALNLKKQKHEELAEAKSISFGKTELKKDSATYFFNKQTCKSCTKAIARQFIKIKHCCNKKEVKKKSLIYPVWTCFNHTLPNITRPSPNLA